MKKLLALLSFAVVALATVTARSQSTAVFAVNYGQTVNLFGTINLSSGQFNKIASIGRASISDIAYCPTNGLLYGISNQSVLVTINETNGTIATVVNLSKEVESLAFRPSDGALFGATDTKLFTINPLTGKTTPVGDYSNPTNFHKSGQNIRFAQDGNLYVSNTSTNTDIYRVNTLTGNATWVGEAVGCPNMTFQNAGQTLYGVATVGSNRGELVSFNLASFSGGGTNGNGGTHQIAFAVAVTNFPANVVFSGGGFQTGSGSVNPLPAPQLACASMRISGGNQFVISWQSVLNQSYRVQCTTNIMTGAWTPVGGSLTGNGAVMSVTNNTTGVPQCYFRLAM